MVVVVVSVVVVVDDMTLVLPFWLDSFSSLV